MVVDGTVVVVVVCGYGVDGVAIGGGGGDDSVGGGVVSGVGAVVVVGVV